MWPELDTQDNVTLRFLSRLLRLFVRMTMHYSMCLRHRHHPRYLQGRFEAGDTKIGYRRFHLHRIG